MPRPAFTLPARLNEARLDQPLQASPRLALRLLDQRRRFRRRQPSIQP